MSPVLNYRSRMSAERRLDLRTIAVAGVLAGALCFASIFIVGPILFMGVTMVGGIVLSALTGRASPGFEFRAGLIASGFAAAAALAGRTLCAPLLGIGVNPPDPEWLVFAAAFWWAMFAIPGLLGSLWFWEGRRARKWDSLPPSSSLSEDVDDRPNRP